MREDEMVGWHHRLNGHGFGWILGIGDGQGGLACWGSWGRKESDTTEDADWSSLRGESRLPLDLPSSCDVLGKYIHHTSLSLSFSAHKKNRETCLYRDSYTDSLEGRKLQYFGHRM